MSLTITSLKFNNFRNYEEFSLDGIQPVTIFVGPNAIGKTNIIEGIQLLTAISSFKNQQIEFLINKNKEAGFLNAQFQDKENDRKISLSLSLNKGKRQYSLNEKNKRPSEVQGLFPSVIFTPDDLDLIKGSHSSKRSALDLLGCQLSKNHAQVKHDFDAVLKQKNRYLKDEEDLSLIESTNDVFITISAQLTCYRIKILERIKSYIYQYYDQISENKESLTVSYIPSWESHGKKDPEAWREQEYLPRITPMEARAKLQEALCEKIGEERARKKAVIGAHADHINFYLNGENASLFASQGQQRSIVLAIKLAEVALINEMLGQKPILLLDDVMSELDESRRAALVDCIHESTQVFITTTNLQYFTPELLKAVDIVNLPLNH